MKSFSDLEKIIDYYEDYIEKFKSDKKIGKILKELRKSNPKLNKK